ncbi:hypothetical protein IC582_018071 [Cucumis melo]|uniref:Uncharacterized protein LOC103484692 n=2 Tax=Cucumis melo TaxID=3656 RepID=A0A1S3B154_CUCME|nr:uncharacterized protein LOC103484692 [Cucumis melo]TYK12967.1 uncharacterized protein E5676_scaffold255G005640 [Cucumis melo var. makuwa]
MEIYDARTGSRLLLVLLILMLHVASCFADSNKAPERPSFWNFIQETVAILKKSHSTPLDKIRSIIHQMQFQFFPPNLDFRSSDETKGGVVDEVKEAVEKSFEVSKDAVEESAKSAAKVMEEAVDKVKENLVDNKDKVKNKHDEL